MVGGGLSTGPLGVICVVLVVRQTLLRFFFSDVGVVAMDSGSSRTASTGYVWVGLLSVSLDVSCVFLAVRFCLLRFFLVVVTTGFGTSRNTGA